MSDKTEREQLQDWLRAELDSFIEWPGDDMTTVTTASAMLFAEHVIGKFKKNHIEQMVPEGWQLVPVEPTPEMTEAGMSVDVGMYETHYCETQAIYAAMLAAAPAAPAAPANEQSAPGEVVAWRGINELGEVVTEWIDGVPPERMVDLCGCPASFAGIQLAYSAQPDAEEVQLLASGEYRPEELWGGSRPTCLKCIDKPAKGGDGEGHF